MCQHVTYAYSANSELTYSYKQGTRTRTCLNGTWCMLRTVHVAHGACCARCMLHTVRVAHGAFCARYMLSTVHVAHGGDELNHNHKCVGCMFMHACVRSYRQCPRHRGEVVQAEAWPSPLQRLQDLHAERGSGINYHQVSAEPTSPTVSCPCLR